MRTTIDIENDILRAMKEIARTENTAIGKVVSRLLREALTGGAVAGGAGEATAAPTGFAPFPSRGGLVTNELIDKLRDAEGV